MVLPDGTWTPPGRGGRLRTLQRQQNLFHWDLEVVVGSQIEVVPTAAGTQEAPFTQESQGTVPAALANVSGRGQQSSSERNLSCSPEGTEEEARAFYTQGFILCTLS